MKQTFIKSIQGHQLEFCKQVYGKGYKISPKNVDFNEVLFLQKDDKGMWIISETTHLPAWFNEISMDVHLAIEENETKEKSTSVFNQFRYLF